jgi:hypothetical protein
MNVAPGTMVSVTLVRRPTSAAATKTLTRLFRKDPRIARHQTRQQRRRPSFQEWRRGNATWHHQMKTQLPFEIEPGSSYSLRATVDVLRDLESVARFVSVRPAAAK